MGTDGKDSALMDSGIGLASVWRGIRGGVLDKLLPVSSLFPLLKTE